MAVLAECTDVRAVEGSCEIEGCHGDYRAVLVFWLRIVVVGEYVATFKRKQLSLLSGIYI